MTLPDQAAVDAHVAAFDAALAQISSPRDAQTLRDQYLGRKHSIVATWMEALKSAPVEQKKAIGALANTLKVAIEARWSRYQEQAQANEENSRLQRDLDALRAKQAASESTMGSELSNLREERDVIRTRVSEMLEQLDALNL